MTEPRARWGGGAWLLEKGPSVSGVVAKSIEAQEKHRTAYVWGVEKCQFQPLG